MRWPLREMIPQSPGNRESVFVSIDLSVVFTKAFTVSVWEVLLKWQVMIMVHHFYIFLFRIIQKIGIRCFVCTLNPAKHFADTIFLLSVPVSLIWHILMAVIKRDLH